MLARIISVRWGKGYLWVYGESGELALEGDNSKIEIGTRSITIRGLFEDLEEFEEPGRSPYKNVYVRFAFPVKGKNEPRGVIYNRSIDTHIEEFGLSYTLLGDVGSFLTIYPPAGALYNYIVLSYDKLFINTLKRRKIYLMRENNIIQMIFV